jgi:coenzyme F420 hydrogenase subunit beta
MSEAFVLGQLYKPNRFTVEAVRAFWDSVADKYIHENESLKETHFQRFQRAFAHFQPAEGMRALNIWSRNGEAIDYFRCMCATAGLPSSAGNTVGQANRGTRLPRIELVNAEVSPRLIAKARARYPEENFIETDLLSLPFADSEFDFILSLETLEHAPDPLGFLRELARVLKPGGRLVLSCPPAAAELPLWIYELLLPNHGEGPHRFPSTREVKGLLHAAGLELKRHESTLFIPAGPRLLRRLDPFVERIVAKTPLRELGIRQFFVCQRPLGAGPWQELIRDVVETNLCTRCGTCVGVCPSGVFEFLAIDEACLPAAVRPEACTGCGLCIRACPGKRVSFAKVRSAAGYAPIQSKELGPIRRIRTAHARDPALRSAGASGGVVTAVLCDLLKRGEITGAIVLDSHPDAPWRPWPRIARTREEIVHAAQSKYCLTPTNVAIKEIDPDRDRVAIVALPCQIHAIRTLECLGHPAVKGVSLIIGLYCGNQLYFGATRSFLRRHGVRDLSEVAEIRYRDGLWPGNVRCILQDGRSFTRPKFQFNHLISFYAVERCLLCADLASEGADFSVADAWNEEYGAGHGSSLVVSRTELGESIVSDHVARGVIVAGEIELEQALAMHAHGLDLKKTGALLRIQSLKQHGRPAPQYDLPEPNPPISRQLAEVLVSAHFRLLRTRPARWILDRIPFGLIGRAYVGARSVWKRSAAKKYKNQNNASPDKRPSWAQWWRMLGPLLLIVMLWRIGPEKCWSAISGADFFWFLAACLLSIPSIAVKGLRWQWMLRAVGFESSFGESTGVYAAGMLAGAVTPGKVGDLAKAPLLLARGLPLSDGVAASLLDRVFDGIVLLALGLGGILAMPALPGRTIIALTALIAIGISIAAVYLFRDSFAKTLHISGVGWWLVMAITTLAASAMYFASAYCCAKAIGLSLGIVDVVAGSSVAAVLALLPISVAGIGTRDAAFVAIFAHCGVDAGQSIAFSSLILAWMLVNCVFFLVVSRCCPHDAKKPQVLTRSDGVISHESAN